VTKAATNEEKKARIAKIGHEYMMFDHSGSPGSDFNVNYNTYLNKQVGSKSNSS